MVTFIPVFFDYFFKVDLVAHILCPKLYHYLVYDDKCPCSIVQEKAVIEGSPFDPVCYFNRNLLKKFTCFSIAAVTSAMAVILNL